MKIISILKITFFTVALALIAGCAGKEDLTGPPPPMGDFLLGHTVVVTKNAKMVPPSRRADFGAWETSLKGQIDKRLGRYQGDKLYHLGIHIDAYVLAVPGVPFVATPKSVLVISLSVFDNATRQRLTEKPRQFNVFERSEKSTFIIGSGIANSKAEQMENLSRNAARLIHKYLLENKAWFGAIDQAEGVEDTATQ